LIKEGKLREEIKKLDASVELWDHNYNLSPVLSKLLAQFTHLKGLSDNNGFVTGEDYNIVLSNNSPKEYADIFSRSISDPTLKNILNYDLIAFKNCYPTTRIQSDQQLEEDINYYDQIAVSIKKYPNKIFILLTPPPARKETTNYSQAQRALKLVAKLNSKVFSNKTPNLKIFDFFGLLADNNGFLKKEYTRLLPWDSHPNKIANEKIAPIFARFITDLVNMN